LCKQLEPKFQFFIKSVGAAARWAVGKSAKQTQQTADGKTRKTAEMEIRKENCLGWVKA